MEPSKPLIQIYILSFNRPDFVIEAVDSALAQDYTTLEVVVSDNSTSSDIGDILKCYFSHPRFKYIRRTPSLPSLEHFNLVLSEVSAPYFMLFHDDDVLLPFAISKMIGRLLTDPQAYGVGGNAWLMKGVHKTRQIFSTGLNEDVTISQASELGRRYISRHHGHPPFPCYLYRKEKLSTLKFDNRWAGKYSDATFLMRACAHGRLLLMKTPLMYYRIHRQNDSTILSVTDLLSLCRFISRYSKENAHAIYLFKMKHYVVWLKQHFQKRGTPLSAWKTKVLKKAAILFVLSHPWIFIGYGFQRSLQLIKDRVIKL